MDDYEENFEMDPLGIVKLPNVKKNVDIISQCSIPKLNNLNPKSRRKTVLLKNKIKGSSIQNSDPSRNQSSNSTGNQFVSSSDNFDKNSNDLKNQTMKKKDEIKTFY